MKKNVAISDSALGAFGEYVYKSYAKSLGLEIQKEGIHQIDFKILNPECKKWIEVDVKTTQKNITKYQGRRIRNDIVYDLIVIKDQNVVLYPDDFSPFRENEIHLGLFQDLYETWKIDKKQHTKREQTQSQVNRKILKKNIKNSVQKYAEKLRVRVVVRGEVSSTRWQDFPDNLPGTSKKIASNDLTIFVKLLDLGDDDAIEKIYAFEHRLLNKIPMAEASQRQLNKGIKQVIDITAFEKEFPNYVFENTDQFEEYLKVI